MRLAVIPARGGSKRIPHKNIKHFLGKPIIAYSIENALASGLFDEVMVSTDCEKIAAIAREYGAKVPFIRPQTLADDFTVVGEVIKHAISWYEEHDQSPHAVCLLYATAPLMRVADLRKGYALIAENEADLVLSVTAFEFPIQRALKLNDALNLEPCYPEFIQMRSQDLEPCYHDAAQFFWGTRDAFKGVLSQVRFKACEINRKYVQDIDNPDDWEFAEILYKAHFLQAQD